MASKKNKFLLPVLALAGLGAYFAFSEKTASAAPPAGTPTGGGGVVPPGAKVPPPPVPVVKEPINSPTFNPAPPTTYTSPANSQLVWRITNPAQGFWFAEPQFDAYGTFYDYWRKFEATQPQSLPATIETWIAYVATSLSNDAEAIDAAKSAAAGLPISSEGSRGPAGGTTTTSPTTPYVDPRNATGGQSGGSQTGR